MWLLRSRLDLIFPSALLAASLTCVDSAFAITLRGLTQQPVERVYKTTTDGTLALHLYVFEPHRTTPDERRPAFVWIYGGGWTSGNGKAGYPQARYFASRGMVAITFDYRLVKPGGPFMDASFGDCKSVIRYIRAHAAELGVDPDRIAVAGDSAGAHLAAALGTVDGFDDPADDMRISPVPNAMLLYNGVFDLLANGRSAVAGSVEAARALSPTLHVRSGAPPAIALHGLDDTVVPPEQSRTFCDFMKAAGNRCDLVLVEHAKHAFVIPNYTAPEHLVVRAFLDGDAFLKTLGYLDGPPTLQSFSPEPESRQGWWMDRHNTLLDRLKQGNADVVFIGDSITQNYEKTNPPDENFKPTWDAFYGSRNALNLGFSGDTTGNVLWRLENGELDGIAPKVAVILIGTNDTARIVTARETEAGIEEIVRFVHGKSPTTKILLLGILPSRRWYAKTEADEQVNALLAKTYATAANVTYLDIAAVFKKGGELQDALFYDPRLKNPSGALHPDTIGQRKMAEAIEPSLCRLLGDRCRN